MPFENASYTKMGNMCVLLHVFSDSLEIHRNEIKSDSFFGLFDVIEVFG